MRYRYCPQCNRQISEYSRQCEYCGFNLSAGEDTGYILEEERTYHEPNSYRQPPSFNGNETEAGYYDRGPGINNQQYNRVPRPPRNDFEQRRRKRKKDDSNFWFIFTICVFLFMGLASLFLVLLKNNKTLESQSSTRSEQLKTAQIKAKRMELAKEKAEGELKEKQRAEANAAKAVSDSYNKAQLEASDFLTTSTSGTTWPLKNASTIRTKLSSRGFKLIDEVVDHYSGGTVSTYTYRYEGKVPGTNRSYSCTVVFDSYVNDVRITFSDSSYASAFESKVRNFYNKKVTVGGYTYRLSEVSDVDFFRTGNTVAFETIGC